VESSLELQRIFHVSKYRLLALEQNIAALLKVFKHFFFPSSEWPARMWMGGEG
jgi:hypothetical protein